MPDEKWDGPGKRGNPKPAPFQDRSALGSELGAPPPFRNVAPASYRRHGVRHEGALGTRDRPAGVWLPPAPWSYEGRARTGRGDLRFEEARLHEGQLGRGGQPNLASPVLPRCRVGLRERRTFCPQRFDVGGIPGRRFAVSPLIWPAGAATERPEHCHPMRESTRPPARASLCPGQRRPRPGAGLSRSDRSIVWSHVCGFSRVRGPADPEGTQAHA